ncbi:MAG: hypothetical protein IPJ19_10830 [Planctomycetes bacterium]|nr:hypothetical protein [Planctomycetota bacterium]
MKQNSLTTACALALSTLVLALSGCGSSSGNGGAGSSGSFRVESISVLEGSTWQINREIEVRFSRDVDFSSVNLNTIQVGQVGGAPAAGEFRLATSGGGVDATRVIFAPRCPTLSDYSDAGFLPGGVTYRMNVVGGAGLTVKSSTGQSLALGQTVNFTTPTSTQASVLFVDTVAGPPSPVIRTTPTNLDASYLEIGGSSDPADRVYFQPRATFNADLGADVPVGFLAPLNLYSQVSEQIGILLIVNQALDPASSNVNAANIRLEYQDGINWIPLAHTVDLIANCTQTGATVRVTPTGILPQDRVVRVVFATGLRDVVGDGNLVDIVVGSFHVSNPGQGVDEFREEFTTGADADQASQVTNPAAPRAEWGGGVLAPNFDFAGTGGPPDGQFDYEIGSSVVGSQPQNPIIDTTFTLITDTTQSRTEAVVDGIVDVRDFTINEGSSLTVLGPNTLKIYASRNVRINGSLIVRGGNNHGVATLGTTCTPEPGADGNAGGGKGGTASYLTTQSTPKGEDGYGAFDAPGLGGGGGHSAYRLASDELRRPGGGGGGKCGSDVMELTRPNCPDQTVVGLDVEAGFPGHPLANDAILGNGVKPRGGTKGPSPFGDGDGTNDFYGLKLNRTTNTLTQGELSRPWAGAGGGAGGDTCQTTSFPTNPFSCSGDEKGCGGGGGGGSIVILALGDITFGTKGKIDATGGAGGGGENSLSGGITRIGGGSGGGSGGHIILQSASQVDLSLCQASNGAGIFARGGQGGEGKNQAGGAHPPGTGPYVPQSDALPPNSYPSTAECAVNTGQNGYTFTNSTGNNSSLSDGTNTLGLDNNVVSCCGGDGGPGIIQIHVQRLATLAANSDLKVPGGTTNTVKKLVSPTPVGASPTNIENLDGWDQMLPQFGRFSTGLSAWIPLGAASVSAGSSTLHPVEFLFGGTNTTTGLVNSAGGSVTQLPSVLSGTIATTPTLPYITTDKRTLVFDATGLDAIYTQNPSLMLRFGVNVTQGATTSQYEVVAAATDAGTMRLSVATSGAPLQAFVPGDTVSVIPRFFRVMTNSVKDALPASATIRVQFQAAPADTAGNPDTLAATAWLNDAAAIQLDVNAANFKFVRFRVDFDILADNSSLTFSTPRPQIDFLRLPFKF